MKPSTRNSREKLESLNENNIEKLIVVRKYQESGVFITSDLFSQYIKSSIKTERETHEAEVEFYQKVYQDFPKKYIATLKYLIPSITQAEKDAKQKTLNKLILENQIQ